MELFVSTPQAVTQLLALPGADAFTGRARAVLPTENSHRTLAFDALRITAYSLHHGRGRRPAVENLGFQSAPDLSGFWVEDRSPQNFEKKYLVIDGQRYLSIALKEIYLFPIQSGAKEIDPLVVHSLSPFRM